MANLLVFGVIGGLSWIIVSSFDKRVLLDAVLDHSVFWRWAALLCVVFIVQAGTGCLTLLIPNLWPRRARKTGLMNDGGRIRMFLRGGADADRWVAVMMLMSTAMTGQRPREWDAGWIQAATALSDDTVDEWQACL